jgi:hypothetical protein
VMSFISRTSSWCGAIKRSCNHSRPNAGGSNVTRPPLARTRHHLTRNRGLLDPIPGIDPVVPLGE